jgi:hypothetical protein
MSPAVPDTFADRLDVAKDAQGHPPETDFQLGPSPCVPQIGQPIGQRHRTIYTLVSPDFNHGAASIVTYKSQTSRWPPS